MTEPSPSKPRKPAPLPKSAPKEIRDFVRCKKDTLEIAPGKLDWLPKPKGGMFPDLPPSLEFEQGAKGSVTIKLGWGFISLSGSVSIVDGKLEVDASAPPPLGDQIRDWVDKFNKDLAANRKKLKSLALRKGKLTLTKTPVSVTETSSRRKAASTKWIAGIGAGAVGLGALGYFVFVDDGPPPPPPTTEQEAAPDPADSGEEEEEEQAVVAVPTHGGEVVVGVISEPSTLNPFLPGGEDPLVSVIGNGYLTGVQSIDGFTSELIPKLVTDLPSVANGGFTENSDGTVTVQYHIRDEAAWSDGTPISGDDFAFTYETIMDPDLPIDKTIYEDIDPDSVVAGPKSFEFTLTEPTIEAELIFGTILPKHEVEGSDFVNDWNDQMWASSGPFVFDTWEKGEFVRLVRNDNFWKTDPETGAELPYLDSVVFRFIPETASLINAFSAREVDVINPPPSLETIEDLQALESEGASVEVLSGPIWEHLNFQFGENRLNVNPDSLNEQLLYRRAIATAINKNKIVDEILRGQVEPIDSYIDAYEPAFGGNAWAQYDYDPELAQSLLGEACTLVGRDCEANAPVAFIDSFDIAVGESIAADLRAIGIDATAFSPLDPGVLPFSGEYDWVVDQLIDPHGHIEFVNPLPDGGFLVGLKNGRLDIFAEPPFIPVSGSIDAEGSFTATGTGPAAGRSDVVAEAEGTVTDQGLNLTYSIGTQGALPGGPITWILSGSLVTPLETGPAPFPDPATVATMVDDFVANFETWIQFGGEQYGFWTFDALGPQVLHSYGQEDCRNLMNNLAPDPTFNIDVLDVSGPGLWIFANPGPGVPITDVITVTGSVTQLGDTEIRDLHFTVDDSGESLNWYTPCSNSANKLLSELFLEMFQDAGLDDEARLGDSARYFGEILDFGNWDLGEWAWVGTPGFAGLVSIHDVFDPEAPPPQGSNFYRWGTPEVNGADPEGFNQGPSSLVDDHTARFAELRDQMNSTMDESELTDLILEAEGILVDQVKLIPLFLRLDPGAVWADEVAGYRHNPSAAGDTWNMEDWYRVDLD